MTLRALFSSAIVLVNLLMLALPTPAQDVGPQFRKIKDGITKELRMPEYAEWAYQDRMPSNIEAAYRAVTRN
jgi:hypothetical protein